MGDHPILTLTRYGFEEYIDGSIVPVCWTKADTAWTTAFFIGLITLFFFLPLAILVILYTIIARTLLVHPSILNPAKNNNVPPNSTLLYRKQVVLMLGTVVLAFFVCLLPFRAFTLWLIIVPTEKVITLGIEGYYNILFFCRIMFHMNSAINPILYNLMSSKFREGFFRLCGFRRRKIKRFINNDKLGRKNTYTNTSISNSTTHTHVTDSFWRRYSSRNASEKSVSVHGSPSKKRHAAEAPPPKVELTQLLHVRKSYSSLSKRFPLHKEESYV